MMCSPPHASSSSLGDRFVIWHPSQGRDPVRTGRSRGRPRKTAAAAAGEKGCDGPAAAAADTGISPGRDTAYQFVTCPEGNPDESRRRAIRSHVMRHRKLKQGYGRVNASAGVKTGNVTAPAAAAVTVGARSVTARNRLLPPQEITTFDAFKRLPIQVDQYVADNMPHFTGKIHEVIFCIEKYTVGFNPMRDYYLPMALQDAALLHVCLFSFGALCQRRPGLKESIQPVLHLKECIRIVNKRLQSPSSERLADSTIATVATLAYVEKHAGRPENWQVHMRGLRQMIHLRGGLEAFRSNRILYNKILRADLCGAIDDGVAPFFEDIRISKLEPEAKHTYQSVGFARIQDRFPFSRGFTRILHRVEELSIALTQIHRGIQKMRPQDLRDELTSIQYKLVYLMQSLSQPPLSTAELVCRLSLQIYLITILNELPPGSLACENTAAAVRSCITEADYDEIPAGLRCWSLLLIGMMVCDEGCRVWAERSWAEIITRQSAFQSQDAVRRELMGFFWVPKIHETGFIKFWNCAFRQN